MVNVAKKMKLVLPVLLVLLVSTDARFPDFGKLFGKLPSIAGKVMSKIPFLKPVADSPKPSEKPTAKKSPPAFCDSHDCPDFYEVKLDATDYTLRCYPESYRWVSTSVTGESARQASYTAFMRLFRYIQGANVKNMKIKMTVPVTNQIQLNTESETSFYKNNFTMSFFIPFKHQKDAPAPSADDVHLTVAKPFCAYVRVYGGYSNMEKVEEHYKALEKALKRDGLADDFHTDMFYSAGYDDPRKRENRHNEIWLVSKKQNPSLLKNRNIPVREEAEELPKRGIFDKLPLKKSDFHSMAEKVMSKLPFLKTAAESLKSYTNPSVQKSSPRFCGSHDCPHFYEKKLKAADYTLRCYPKPYSWVSTTVTGESSEEAGKTAFWRLFNYIQGENVEKMKIDMTVPVTNQIQLNTESETSFYKNNFTTSFFIPFKHQKDAPAPTADDVHLTVAKPFCAYVRVYGGYSNMETVEQHYKALVKALERDGLADDFHADMIYSAGYDEPWKRRNRHNEIWLVSKKQSPSLRLIPVREEAEELTKRGIFDKLPFKKSDIHSMAEKVMSKMPFLNSAAEKIKSYINPSANKSSSRFCGSHDCPHFYEKKLNATDYTLRCYPKPYSWVSTTVTVTGKSSREAGKSAFWRLFNYIQGENEEKMKIKMTVPVTRQFQLDTESESFSKNNYTMSFFIPFKHQKDAPAPTANDVHLTVVKPFCAYVRVYGGYSNMNKVEQHYKALVKALERDGLGSDFNEDVMYSAGYDGPMKFLFRHNEIWLVSKTQIPDSNIESL